MGLQRDFDHMRWASALDNRITPTLEDIMKAQYVENNPQYRDDLTFTNFRNSHEVIENTYQQIVAYIGYNNFDFSDSQEVNDKLIHDFWVTFFTRNYYKALNFETYDQWATMLFAKLNELMPLYNTLIKKRLTDMWVTHDTNTTGTSESNSTSDSTNKNTSHGSSTTDTNGTANENGETQSIHNNAFTDTPQNQLAISAENPGYATTLTGDNTDGTSKSDRTDTTHSVTTTENEANSNGNVTGNVNGETAGHAAGRDFDVFVMTQNWANSGYGVWLDIFDRLDKAPNPLFSRVNITSKGLEMQEKRYPTYPSYRWFY